MLVLRVVDIIPLRHENTPLVAPDGEVYQDGLVLLLFDAEMLSCDINQVVQIKSVDQNCIASVIHVRGISPKIQAGMAGFTVNLSFANHCSKNDKVNLILDSDL